MHNRRAWRVAGAAAFLLVGVSAAWAQSAGAERQSLLKIIRDGIEIPTYFILIGSVVTIALIVEHFLTVRAASISPVQQVKQVRGVRRPPLAAIRIPGIGRVEDDIGLGQVGSAVPAFGD